MAQVNIFDIAHLNHSLQEAVARSCRTKVRDGTEILCYQNITGIKIFPGPQAIVRLGQELSKWASQNASTGPESLPNLMLEVSIYVSDVNLRVLGPPWAVRQLRELQRLVAIDFALICALSLAESYGYSIPTDTSQWEVMRSVLAVKDDDSLVRIFRESLPGNHATSGSGHAVPNPVDAGRSLSAESFWNLVSMAYVENWSDSVMLQLIGEHLNPGTHPDLVRYSHTVSGDEWLKIHDRVMAANP